METTVMFVELIVVGIGPLIVLFIGALTLHDLGHLHITPDQVPKLGDAAIAALLLGLSYGFGTLVDKLAYVLFYCPEKVLRKYQFKAGRAEPSDYHTARNTLYISGKGHAELIRLYEFGRSKIRIARGWAVNGVLIAAALYVYREESHVEADPLDVMIVGAIVVALWSAIAWGAAQDVDVKLVKGVGNALNERAPQEKSSSPCE